MLKMPYLKGKGGPEYFLSHWNPNILVTEEPIQNFRALQQALPDIFEITPIFLPNKHFLGPMLLWGFK